MKREDFDLPEFVDRHERLQEAVRYRDGPKRLLDRTLICLTLPISVPLIGLLWLLVRLDGGAGFFGHQRVGLDGHVFTCWKLRTMVPNARERLRKHLASNRRAARQWAQYYKLDKDPRITWIGRFLRATSLDELPQLWNVWRGEMSLVGPRPVPREELIEYAGFERAYFTYRPGITGLWQVSGRNAVSYPVRVSMDLRYSVSAGIWTDLGILGRTIWVVLSGNGR